MMAWLKHFIKILRNDKTLSCQSVPIFGDYGRTIRPPIELFARNLERPMYPLMIHLCFFCQKQSSEKDVFEFTCIWFPLLTIERTFNRLAGFFHCQIMVVLPAGICQYLYFLEICLHRVSRVFGFFRVFRVKNPQFYKTTRILQSCTRILQTCTKLYTLAPEFYKPAPYFYKVAPEFCRNCML